MIPFESLLQIFHAIVPRSDHDALGFTVRPMPGGARVGWIGRNMHTGVAFLLPTGGDRRTYPAIALPLIRVRHGVQVSVDDGFTTLEATVSLLECLARDPPTIELFVRAVAGILTDDARTDERALSELIDRLLNLFRDYSYAGDAECLGLWAELFVIAHCPFPAELARQWRNDPRSRYDFGSDTERLEVKATTSAKRHHELSFTQAHPPRGVDAAFVSIMTEQVSYGTSIHALWDRVIALAPDSQATVDEQCVRTLGRDWQTARNISFDSAKAAETLQVYPATGVPKLGELPKGVLSARFISDFGTARPWQGSPPTPKGPIAAAMACVASS